MGGVSKINAGTAVLAVAAIAFAGGVSAFVALTTPAAATQPLSVRPEISVVVTIPPLVGLLQAIAPEGVKITGLMQPGQSEHGYEFRPSDMSALARSDMVVYVGLGLEPGIAKFMLRKPDPRRQVVVLGEIVGLQKPGEAPAPHVHKADEKDGDHDHHADHDEDHAAPDVHIWLDPVLVKSIMPQLGDALKKVIASKGAAWAQGEKEVDAKLAATIEKIDELDKKYRTTLSSFKGKSIVTHHAAFGRLAQRYDIKIAEVIRPFESIEPTPGQLDECIKAIHAQKVKTIFIEPQFNAKAAEKIAQAAHVRLGVLDPLGSGDWFKLMESNLKSLADGLADEPAPGAAPK